MTDPQVAIFMLSMFIFLVLLGFPIAFTLIAMGVGFGYEIASDSWRYKEVSWNSPARIQIYYFKSLIPIA